VISLTVSHPFKCNETQLQDRQRKEPPFLGSGGPSGLPLGWDWAGRGRARWGAGGGNLGVERMNHGIFV
jgi:hypothetical protein